MSISTSALRLVREEMAKKKQEVAPPAISTIPLADQDSPLVIDLPDGQKLVVGNIAHGTVIEVATWRGTGRPDSRTSRLMLGVSSASAVDASASSPSSSDQTEPKKQNPIEKFVASLMASTPKRKRKKEVEAIDELLSESAPNLPEDEKKKGASRVSRALDEGEDIQQWLDQLMSGSSSDFLREKSDDGATSTAGSKGEKRAKVKRISSPRAKKNSGKGSRKSNSARSSSIARRKSSKSRPKGSRKR